MRYYVLFAFCNTVNDNNKIRKGRGKMEEKISIRDHYLWIRMPRELDHHMASAIRDEADRKMTEDAVRDIVFDFSETEFMDSSGIGVIVGRYKKMDCLGGRVLAVHANKRIRQILCLAGLDQLVEITD